jgi:hypothetical protein
MGSLVNLGWGTPMIDWWWTLGAVAAVVLVAAVLVWPPIRLAVRNARLADARRDFHLQRERLEMKFIQLAVLKSKPDAPHWIDCAFDNDVAYVRNRATGELVSFVGITVALGDLEDSLSRMGIPGANLRVGTAVFRFDRTHWDTDGVALLNMSPIEAIRFYQNNIEVVAHEAAK